jgi:signal transduction histidine kinase
LPAISAASRYGGVKVRRFDLILAGEGSFILVVMLSNDEVVNKLIKLPLSITETDLQVLSANVVTVTREEEILNTKMRVHDEMGRCLLAIQKYLKEDSAEKIPVSIVESWQKAVSMLKYNNDTSDDDMLLQIRKTCESIKLDFVQVGELPKEEKTAYILICAVRECVTNAARYAEATKLYAEFTENETTASVKVTNNGIAPTEEISEGGGLSSLRSRVERFGGEMLVQSFPEFSLTVTVPKRKEGLS